MNDPRQTEEESILHPPGLGRLFVPCFQLFRRFGAQPVADQGVPLRYGIGRGGGQFPRSAEIPTDLISTVA